MKYIVEVAHTQITPIVVEATLQREAEQKALNNEGEAGQQYPGEPEIISVRRVQGGD